MKTFQRIISFLLALILAFGLMPVVEVRAEETGSAAETVPEGSVAAETVAEEAVTVETAAAETTEETAPATEPAEAPAETEAAEETTAATEETIPAETVSQEASSPAVDSTAEVLSGSAGYEATWTLVDGDTLVISGTGETWRVEGKTDEEHQYLRNNVKHAVVCDGITKIGYETFYYLPQLESVEIAESVKGIGGEAFQGCSNLKEITIPDSVTVLGNWAFKNCVNLVSVTLPKNLQRLGTECFKDCKSLDSITIPGSLTSVAEAAFYRSGLKEVILENGVMYIEKNAFYSCSQLERVTLPEGLYSIGEYAFQWCDLKEITIPKSVQYIKSLAFDGCYSLTMFFRGSAPIVTSLIYDGFGSPEITAWYPGDDITWTPDVMAIFGPRITWRPYDPDPTGDFHGNVLYFSENISNSSRAVHLDYEDSFFLEDSRTYRHDLAKASLKLAMSAFVADKSRTGGAQGDAKNAYDFLHKIGCSVNDIEDYGYDSKPSANSIACVIGSKQLLDQEETLVIVAVRGQGYESEWAGNFLVGPNSGYHKGFSLAVDQVLPRLYEYLENHEEITGNIKLWITGYSRAGAVANIVAGKLVNGTAVLPDKVTLEPHNLFAYTFEAPAGVKGVKAPRDEQYDMIFNIVNSTDFVPKLAMEIWGYYRYGKDLFLPDLSGKDTLDVASTYQELTNSTYTMPFRASLFHPRQSLFLDLAFSKLGITVGGEPGYVALDQQTLVGSCVTHNGLPSFDVIFNGVLAYAAALNLTTIEVILFNANEITFGHYPENCLAMMETLENEDGYYKGNYKYYIVKCPVDIAVMDDSGNTVAAIQNDAVSQIGNENVDVYVDENGDKYVFILDDTSYELLLTATDDGEMDCTVVSYQQGQGKTSQSAFFDVPLVKGESYTAPFSLDDDNYVLYGEDVTLTPDAVSEGDVLRSAAVAVDIVGSGSVIGATDGYTVGDTVTLMAEADEGAVFAGWFADGEPVCQEEVYTFGLEEDCTVTAVFLSGEISVTMDREYVALEPGETVQLSARVQPEILTGAIRWTMENGDETVASVDESGLVSAASVGTAYVLASLNAGGTEVTARCRVDVAQPEPEAPVIQLNGIGLSAVKLTSELYSAQYAQFDLLLELPQNYSAMSVGYGEIAGNNGVAIENVGFVDPAAAEIFDLVVLDDRRIAIVPTQYAMDNPKVLAKSYKSAVTATVDGREFTTDEILTLTVKQSKPKLKASISGFNAFYTGQTQPITITGATATKITGKTIPGWLTLNEDFTLSLNENASTRNSGKAVLLVETEEWRIPAEVSLSVKNTFKAPGLKLNVSSVKLSETVANAGIELQLLPRSKKDTLASLEAADIVTLDGGYKVEDFDPETGNFTLRATYGFRSGSLTLWVRINGTEEAVPVKLTVKAVTAAPAVTFKASRGLNPDIPEDQITVQPAFKNYSGSFSLEETETEQFLLKQDGKSIAVRCKDGVKAGSYTVPIILTLDGGTTVTGSVKLSVKSTPVKLKLSASRLSLNNSVADRAFVTVACATKGYELDQPIVSVMDKTGKVTSDGLTVDLTDGKLTVCVNDNTVSGATYKVLVKANETASAATLTVTIAAENKSVITSSLKAKGSIDVIRDGTAVTLTPSYKNVGNLTEKSGKLAFYKTAAKQTAPADDLFAWTCNTDGTFTVTRAEGAKLDHSAKYTVKLVSTIGSTVVESKAVSLSVKQGSAKLSLASEGNSLFAKDKHSRVNFTLSASDAKLNAIAAVTSKDARFVVYNYGNGEFALGFVNDTPDKSLLGKTVTVTLNIFLDGNETAKANTTAKLKVTVVK